MVLISTHLATIIVDNLIEYLLDINGISQALEEMTINEYNDLRSELIGIAEQGNKYKS